jgi:tetratricopeptide (TPR) repeat protein
MELGQVGKAHLAISSGPASQADFDTALAILHSFFYPEARLRFEALARREPTCAMAQWGIAMSYYHPLWAPPTPDDLKAGSAAARRAAELGGKTPLETGFIDAINTFYRDSEKVDHPSRTLAYEAAMASLHQAQPENDEVTIFYALALNGSFLLDPSDKSYAKPRRAGAMLEEMAGRNPRHPGIAHYIIHSYDYPPLAEKALVVARGYAAIAPKVPHALHMPSHIFTRMGLWDESIASNLAAQKASEEYMALRSPGKAFSDELHAMDYLEYAYLQSGQLARARDVIDQAKSVKGVEPANDFASAFALAAIPARYALETRSWQEAADLRVNAGYIDWAGYPHMAASLAFANVLGAAKRGNLAAAKQAAGRLQALKDAIPPKLKYWRDPVEAQRRAALAWIAQAEGRKADALGLLRSAADLEDATDKHPVTPGAILPAREQLGDLLMEQGQPDAALPEYEKALKVAPNRFNALAGAARAARGSGQPKLAAGYYRDLLGASKTGERPEVQEARAYLQAQQQTAD